VHTETPPIINYALTIPVMLGGSLLAYQVFFALCNIAAALLLYNVLRRWGEEKGSMVALLYLMNPFTLYHATFNPQDEPLVLLFFLLPLAFFLVGRFNRSAVALGVGIWAKMFPLLMLPLFMIQRMDPRTRLQAIGLIAAVSALIIVPFLVIAAADATWFLRFYFLGVGEEGSGGVSLWHFLNQIGLKPPSIVMLGLVGLAVIGGYWYAYRREWETWRTLTLVVCLFFLVYPKIHSGYFLLPLVLLLPYIVNDIKLYGLTFLLFGTVIATFKFADGTISPDGGMIAVPILLTLITDLILIFLVHRTVLRDVEGPMVDVRPARRVVMAT
jgi:uncharacterized membrane protein